MSVKMPAKLNLNLFNAAGDQIDYTFYDRLALANSGGTDSREFFVVGIGETDSISTRRKTLADTNVRKGSIPEGQSFGCFALKFYFEMIAALTEAQRILLNVWIHGITVEVLIDSKNQYGTWKLSEILGKVDDSQITAGASGQAFEASRGDYDGIKKFNLYIPLPRLTSFTVRLNFDAASDAALDDNFINLGMVGLLNRAG